MRQTVGCTGSIVENSYLGAVMGGLDNPRRHDDLLNYRLKRLVAVGGAPAVRLCEGRFGVARAEWRLVAALVEEGPMSPSALARRCLLEPARVSRLVTALLGKGLIARTEAPGDRRRASLQSTAAGEALYRELFPQLVRINRRLVEALSEDEARVLDTCLGKLMARARGIEAEGGGVEARANRWMGTGRRNMAR